MPLTSKKAMRRDKIVQAAGKLFAYQGYHGTSTRQIAHLAGVTENTVFRHFNDKESLFWSTLQAHCAPLEFRRDLNEGIQNCEPPEAVLPKILEMFSDTAIHSPELLRLIAIAFVEMHPKAEAFFEELLSPALSAISRYLATSIERGKLRDSNATTLTAALVATSLTQAEVTKLIDKNKPASNYQEKNRAQARFWLDLLAPGMPACQSSVALIAEQNHV